MSSENWKTIKESLSIPELCRRMNIPLEVKRNKALCPIHQEKTPSFNLYENGTRFKCYGCGAVGDVGDMYVALAQCDSKQAYADLCEMLNLDPKDGVTGLYERPTPRRVSEGVKQKRKDCEVTQSLLRGEVVPELTQWLERKGVNYGTFLRCCVEGDLTIECGKLVFIYNTGRKERGDWEFSRGNRWIQGGAEGALWRIQEVRDFNVKTIIMCEGESDAMRVLTELGGRTWVGVVAIPSASWVPDEAMANLIGRNRNVVFLFDNDKAGRIAAEIVGAKLYEVEGCHVYKGFWPEEYKDVCDMPQEMLQKELDKILTLS